jgi:hypothetical protein
MLMIEEPIVARSQRIQSPKEASSFSRAIIRTRELLPNHPFFPQEPLIAYCQAPSRPPSPPDINVRVAVQRPDDQAKTNSESNRSVM